jgi:hypothetical protein
MALGFSWGISAAALAVLAWDHRAAIAGLLWSLGLW